MAPLLLLGAALALTACNTYYIPPPPVSVVLNNFTPNLVIKTINSNGDLVPATLQLSAAVANSPNQNLIYSVGQLGNFVTGGSNALGFVSSAGVYTAPQVVPIPNEVVIQAVAQVDPTQKATTTITLLNQPANPTSLTPSIVTTGGTYTFDLQGNYFAPNATAQLSGALMNSVQIVSPQEAKVNATITAPGLLSLSLNNPVSAGDTNAVFIRSQPSSPPTSGAVAVIIAKVRGAGGTLVNATKAYVPEPSGLAVVNLDTNQQIASIPMPNGFVATLAAAHPSADEIVVADAATNILQVVDADHDLVISSLALPSLTPTTVDGASCEVCGLMVDSARHRAILDTGSGYFSVDLTSGAATVPIAAPPAANFAYDPTTQRIYAPFANASGSGVNVIDLAQNTVTAALPGQGQIYGSGTDSATLDPATSLLTVGDAATGNLLAMNFNSALASTGTVQAPASSYTITGGCPGSWNAMNLEFTSHLGWFANLGQCVAVASLPAAPASGAPGGVTNVKWAVLPNAADGLPWGNSPLGSPHTLAVFLGLDGRAFGLAVRQDGLMLAKVDLLLLQSANPVSGGRDANQVDAQNVTVNGQTVSALTYIALH